MSNSKCRINALPDDLLRHILSFLCIKNAVQASVLSKRWKTLPWCMPALTCDQSVFYRSKAVRTWETSFLKDSSKCDFFHIVNRFLLCHNGALRAFRLTCNPNERWKKELFQQWMHYLLVDKNIEELEVDFSISVSMRSPDHPEEVIRKAFLPWMNYFSLEFDWLSSGSLTSLRLNQCVLRYPPKDGFNSCSVKTMTLSNVVLNGQILDAVLRACPLLENLELLSCMNSVDRRVKLQPGDLEISSPTLKNFTLMFYDEIKGLKFNAPALESIKFYSRKKWVVDAVVLFEFLTSVSHVKSFHTHYDFVEILFKWKDILKFMEFGNLESFTITSCLNDRRTYDNLFLEEISFLSGWAPSIEKLLFQGRVHCYFHSRINRSPNSPVSWFCRLKKVRIVSFKGKEDEIEMVDCFLSEAQQTQSLEIMLSKLPSQELDAALNALRSLKERHPGKTVEILTATEDMISV